MTLLAADNTFGSDEVPWQFRIGNNLYPTPE